MPRDRPRAASRRGLLALAALLLVCALAAPAHAHAQVAASDPADGARLDVAPTMVHVTLTQGVERGSTTMRVTDADGQRVDEGELQFAGHPDRPELSLHLRPALPDGAYTVTIHTLSADSHPVTHRIGFAVGAYEPPGSGGSDDDIPWRSVLGRALMFAGYAAAFGAAAMGLWLRAPAPGPRRTARAIALGALLHLAGAAVLLHYTATASGLGLSSLTQSDVGRSQYARLVLAVAAAALAGVASRSRHAPHAAVALLLASAGLTAFGSHSSQHGPTMVALDLLHLLATTCWVGSLGVLLAMARPAAALAPLELRAAGRRFGTIGLAAVAVLLATGAILTASIAGADALLHPTRLTATTWGRALAGKVALVAAMLAVAAVNRLVLLEEPRTSGLAGALQRLAARATGGRLRPLGPPGSGRPFHRVVATEAGLGCLVLALAGLLTALAPTQAEPGGPDELRAEALGAEHAFTLTFLPRPAAGASGMAHLVVTTLDGTPVDEPTCRRADGACVTLTITQAGVPTTYPLAPDGQGAWMAHDLLWTSRGAAEARIEVATEDVFHDEATVAFSVA